MNKTTLVKIGLLVIGFLVLLLFVVSFFSARIATLLLEMFIMWFFITLLKLNSDIYVIIFTILTQILVVVGNYILSKIFVFKKVDC